MLENTYIYFQNKCQVIHCPIGSFVHNGGCERIALRIDNLWIAVLFQLTFVWDHPELNNTGNKTMFHFSSLGSVIYEKFHALLGFREAKCKDWNYKLLIGRQRKPDDVRFIFWAELKLSNESCSLGLVYARSAAVIGQTVNIETNETNFKLIVSLEKKPINIMERESERLIQDDRQISFQEMAPSGPVEFRLCDARTCPLIELEYEDSFFVPTTLAKGFRSFFAGSEVVENSTTVQVCVDDYFAVMAPNHANDRGTICCFLLLTMLTNILMSCTTF